MVVVVFPKDRIGGKDASGRKKGVGREGKRILYYRLTDGEVV